jgi:hypothetical protein
MITDPRLQCTDLRLQLFANGFVPLPNQNKMCLLPEWTTVEVTPDLIRSREWTRSAKLRDTGVRCGDVIAVDWDIDDRKTLNDMLDAAVAAKVIPESRFVRIGKAPREMWLYRTSDKIGKLSTGFFAKPDADADAKGEQVEILGRGCQFAAFGLRDPATPYTWPDLCITDYKYMDLPEITLEQVKALKDFAILFFEESGFARRSAEGGNTDGYNIVYDLTPDMKFDVKELGEVTVAELETYLEAHPTAVLRCRMEALRPGTSGSWAGMASLASGMVCISDHGSSTTHYPARPAGEDSLAKLGEMLLTVQPSNMFERVVEKRSTDPMVALNMNPNDSFDDNFGVALQRFIYLTATDTIADARDNTFDMTLPHLGNRLRPYYRSEPGIRGGETIIRLADAWMQDPSRQEAYHPAMRPDMPYPLFVERETVYYNSYRPARLPLGGDATIGFDLLEKLLPIPSERHFFTQWLAFKVLNPDTRGPGVIMVANDTYGTGRGSLVELISDMFAKGLVRQIDFETLAGRGTQGQYNEWMADAILVAVNEAHEAAGPTSKWAQRQSAYEKLKEIVDPGHHELYVKRKGMANYQGRTSASILVMTNHADSVVLPPGDRRFAILENGKQQPQEYWQRFHAWRSDLRNVGAFVEALKHYPVEGYNPNTAPPMSNAKLDMIDAGTSPLDRAVDSIIRSLEGTLLMREQLTRKLEIYLNQHSVEFPEDWQRLVERIFQRRTRRVPDLEFVPLDGRYRQVRAVREVPPEVLTNDETVMAEVMRNGPISTAPVPTGKPVNF